MKMLTWERVLMKMIVIGVCSVVGLILFLILNPLVIISSGDRGVVLKWGALTEEILAEGIHWVKPISKSVYKMSVMTQKEEQETTASSKDLQVVTTKIAINFKLDGKNVNKLYQNLKYEYKERVIDPTIEESVKQITAQYTAEELITKREEAKSKLKKHITEALLKNYILVEDIFITNFQFSEGFDKAIEAKVTAEQEALQQKNKLEQVKYEAEQRVTQARAEAESIKIQAQAIQNQGGKDYVQMQAIAKWDGHLPTQMIPNASLPFLNIGNK